MTPGRGRFKYHTESCEPLTDNLVQAFSLAVHPAARDRGVLIAFNDRISSAFYTSKASANRLDTFRSHEQGHLGLFTNYTPHFFFTPARATDRKFIELDLEKPLPEVGLVFCYTDIKEKVIDDALSDSAVQGLVLAAFGSVRPASNQPGM